MHRQHVRAVPVACLRIGGRAGALAGDCDRVGDGGRIERLPSSAFSTARARIGVGAIAP